MTNHYAKAMAHLEAAKAARQALDDHYELEPYKQSQAQIAALNQAIRFGMKAAEIHAQLAIVEQQQAASSAPRVVTL